MAHHEDIESAIDRYYRRRDDDEAIEQFEEIDETGNSAIENEEQDKIAFYLVRALIIHG